jgi:transcriptional regulator GlxA family with amidase domain
MPRGGFEKRAIEKAFNELTGMTMPDYAHRRRVFHAAFRLLTPREEPRRISKALGWASTGEFTKQFASVFDIPPAVYREKFGLPSEEKAAGEKAEREDR